MQRDPAPQRHATPEGQEEAPRATPTRSCGGLDATQLLGRLKVAERYSPWHPSGARASKSSPLVDDDSSNDDVSFFGLPLLGKHSLFQSTDLGASLPGMNWLMSLDDQGSMRTSPRKGAAQSPRKFASPRKNYAPEQTLIVERPACLTSRTERRKRGKQEGDSIGWRVEVGNGP